MKESRQVEPMSKMPVIGTGHSVPMIWQAQMSLAVKGY